MSEGFRPLYIQRKDLAAFLACLGLGTLYAIRQGVLPPEAGIWTLGRPRVWDDSGVPDEIAQVFSTAGELSAIKIVIPNKFDAVVEDLIHRLEVVLASTGEQYWLAGWSLHDEEQDPTDVVE